ncbi:MAG: Eco57I restriction-modification methylase domain-containing protein [Chloroflexi bacterium]|nr:Eco57I restriction-modification methylase domain-containing protein [Chloroflexota bacterium]
MPLNRNKVIQNIKDFNLTNLFIEELGWNRYNKDLFVALDEQTYRLTPIAEKGGLVVYCCTTTHLPDYAIRRRIEREVVKSVHEHIIIFADTAKTTQIWQWVRRETGKPDGCRESTYHKHQSGESLFQKLQELLVSFEEEATIIIGEVKGKVKKAFDVETITKKFYERFQKEHAAFLKFIQNIPVESDSEWYASLMLNRLMFIYFIQKKGFLDGDTSYLRHRLQRLQHSYGTGKFHGFYRQFLLRLFHEGLGQQTRSPELTELLGKVPYLNGGLFEVHELERHNPDIQIPDEAFERIFTFFDAYSWHLDERPLRADNEINPDVLGYIFEKYINQKQMGAYYTKEDITEYISKNTIIPFLFDKAGVEADNVTAWQLLRDNPNRYIYPAVQHGIEKELPSEIADGLTEISKRTNWNKAALDDYALPTEIWREVVARRKRYEEIYVKLVAGEIQSINDLITYNLNIRQFAQDVIENCSDPVFLWSFYQAIANVKVLDPTCGSGAFLFAALNLLEPLYEACLERMGRFISEADQPEAVALYRKFEELLRLVDLHPNRRYFVLKSIIIQNLYGVDIMAEAVEIAKLRLFLKLVAQIEKVEQVEPLPDIDFNIRPGNTLVGFATFEEAKAAIDRKFDFDGAKVRIEQKAKEVDSSFKLFRNFQTQYAVGEDKASVAVAIAQEKQKLRTQIAELQAELDRYLAGEYGIDLLHLTKKKEYEAALEKWRISHQPFHWFVEFYGIMAEGGFDVIIGNPPYLELREVDYAPRNFKSAESSAIHAMCIERSLQLLRSTGAVSMIVPLALVSTQRMQVVQQLLEQSRVVWYSNYSWRPGKLFDTVNRALTIFVAKQAEARKTYSTNYQKWTSDNRSLLMPYLSFVEAPRQRNSFWVPKAGNEIERYLLEKLLKVNTTFSHFTVKSEHRVFYRTTGGLYWKVFTNFAPDFKVNEKAGHSTRETWFSLRENKMVNPSIATLSSDLFWWWYTITTNCRDLNPSDIQKFPFPPSLFDDSKITSLGHTYLQSLQDNSTMLVRIQKQTGRTETQSFKIQKSKPIIDQIDRVLAEHYGFTEEELDFIINYDIKYRMGRESGDEGEA